MIKTSIKVFLLLFSISISSCVQQSQESQPIELNQGKKWKVNAEMLPHIQASEKLLSDFLANEGKDYTNLAKDLKKNNDKLIKSCNMKGKAHDELHKWLHPYMDLIKTLEQEENEEIAKSIVNKLIMSFETFNQYFQ